MRIRSRISLVTASYNMERYIEETLASVTGQHNANLEYILIDGASTDGTMSIVSRYRDSIDIVQSEPDEGQYHAINKGFSLSTGDIMAWINADDVLMPWTLSVVHEIFESYPEIDWITGLPSFLNEKGQLVQTQSSLPVYPRKFIANGWYQEKLGAYLQQESMFWRRSLWNQAGGGLDLKYGLAADFELWTRFAKFADLVPVGVPLAAFRERPGEQRSSHGAEGYAAEVAEICKEKKPPPWLWRRIAQRGLISRSLARLLIWHRGNSVVYDRRRGQWTKIGRWRSISRIGVDDLADQWLLRRRDRPS